MLLAQSSTTVIVVMRRVSSAEYYIGLLSLGQGHNVARLNTHAPRSLQFCRLCYNIRGKRQAFWTANTYNISCWKQVTIVSPWSVFLCFIFSSCFTLSGVPSSRLPMTPTSIHSLVGEPTPDSTNSGGGKVSARVTYLYTST